MSQRPKFRNLSEDQKLQGHRAEDALAEPYLEQKFLVIWLQQITMFSVKVVNLETIIDVQSWCRTWPPNGSKRIRAKQKLHRETHRSLQKFLEPNWKPEVIYIVRRHHTDRKQMGLLKEQCAEWKKAPLLYCSNQVWMKIGGRFLLECLPICETFKISCLMGGLHIRDVWWNHFKGPIIPFGSLVEYHPITSKDQSMIHQFGKKVSPGLFLGYALFAEWIWKGDI